MDRYRYERFYDLSPASRRRLGFHVAKYSVMHLDSVWINYELWSGRRLSYEIMDRTGELWFAVINFLNDDDDDVGIETFDHED